MKLHDALQISQESVPVDPGDVLVPLNDLRERVVVARPGSGVDTGLRVDCHAADIQASV